ncbi:hypothetical protein ACVWWN_002047 [Mycobacterium sp. URHB0021]
MNLDFLARLRSGWWPNMLSLLTSDGRLGWPEFVGPGCDDGVMSSTASLEVAVVRAGERVEVLFGELSELAGQRNAIDGRIVQIVAELDHDGLCGSTGARSIAALVAWKLGASSGNAATIAAIAHRLPVFPRCGQGMREGRLSLDQVGVIAGGAADGSDEHYAEFARVASVSQLRTAVKLEPRPDPDPDPDVQPDVQPGPESQPQPRPDPEPRVSISSTSDETCTQYRITLPHLEAAKFDAALRSHREALVAEGKRDHAAGGDASGRRPPLPSTGAAFLRWWMPAGTPRRRPARTGSTPPWWSTSMSRTRSLSCIWVRCCRLPIGAT